MEETMVPDNLTNDKRLEENINLQDKEATFVLAADKDYFDAYFEICRLYQLKRVILNKIVDKRSKGGLLGKDCFNRRIYVLNNRMKKLEALFWDNVEESQKNGVKFAIEEIAAKFGMELFEKRLILFFLYLEHHAIERNICFKDELLYILDTENSILSRMRDSIYFNTDAVLMDKRLIFQECKIVSGSERKRVSLSANTLGIIALVLSGKECPDQISRDSSSSETVGYVKDPEYKFEDIKLSEEVIEKVTFFLHPTKENRLEKLGVSQRVKKGLGTAFLFHGPPGTGKSMLAEAVAAYVGKKVLVVEYPKIMDRYLGDTDKNITKIFKSAKKEGLVVLLDEADTLFYNRSFAHQEHDIRFVNEMMQELERFEGIIVLTTNMDTLLDPALERRLSLKIKFELPSKELRFKIWQSHIPEKVKLAKGVDFEFLAQRYEFSGGNIKNAVMNAFRRIASKNIDMLTLEDLIFGANLEKEGMFSEKTRLKVVQGFSNY